MALSIKSRSRLLASTDSALRDNGRKRSLTGEENLDQEEYVAVGLFL